jgi:hypothetical protein
MYALCSFEKSQSDDPVTRRHIPGKKKKKKKKKKTEVLNHTALRIPSLAQF